VSTASVAASLAALIPPSDAATPSPHLAVDKENPVSSKPELPSSTSSIAPPNPPRSTEASGQKKGAATRLPFGNSPTTNSSIYKNMFHHHVDMLRSQDAHSKPDDGVLKPPPLVSQVASSQESTLIYTVIEGNSKQEDDILKPFVSQVASNIQESSTIDTARSLNFDLEAVADSSVVDIMDEDEELPGYSKIKEEFMLNSTKRLGRRWPRLRFAAQNSMKQPFLLLLWKNGATSLALTNG
jgi:hypothetical protein